MDLPKRKPHRLTGYDYATNGAYFITCCTKDRQCLFWIQGQTGALSPWGSIVEHTIREIPVRYPSVKLQQFVVMPNHIHLLLLLEDGSPSISTIINQMKGAATKRIGRSVWQKLFHDHIVRDEHEFLEIWQYIATNPARWLDDCFYRAEEL